MDRQFFRIPRLVRAMAAAALGTAADVHVFPVKGEILLGRETSLAQLAGERLLNLFVGGVVFFEVAFTIGPVRTFVALVLLHARPLIVFALQMKRIVPVRFKAAPARNARERLYIIVIVEMASEIAFLARFVRAFIAYILSRLLHFRRLSPFLLLIFADF